MMKLRFTSLWRKLRLPYKLGLVYTPLILLPALAGIYYVTDSYTVASKTSTAKYATDLLSLMGQKIDDRMRSYQLLSKQIMTDGDLIRAIQSDPVSSYERFRLEGIINEKLNVLWLGADQNEYIRSIIVETPSSLFTYGKSDYGHYGVDDSGYRSQVREMKGAARWFEPEIYDDGYNAVHAFRLGRTIRDAKLNELGTLTIVIQVEAFADIFSQTHFQEDAALKLLSEYGTVLVDNGVEIGPGEKQLLSFSEDKLQNGWKLSAQLPLQNLYEPIYNNVRLAVYFVFVCIALGLIVTHLLALDLVIPIRRLMMNMKLGIKGVRPGQLKHFKGAVEVVEMNDTFISVMYEIEHLIEEVAKQEKKKKDAEIRVLQNQLSPHFLYNTLNSIRWMAMIQKQDNIKEMVDSLNQLLTYALRRSGDPVTLADEIAILHNYAAIQKVRYQHFGFATTIPSSLENVLVLKFMLQPLIENALIHGLSPSDHPGEIRIEAWEEDGKLMIAVNDNGIGMTPDRLKEVTGGLVNPEQHFGLHSVHERIQLHYGRHYGLTIESEADIGTRITVMVPLTRAEESGGKTYHA
ncbi:sensor histidine kinase [Paenibacillus spongiae]|uniref:Sensor histidine kinase n=1 Tax=Paenibacillus spongiae TaxID=2909671 RepID=A0ABY5SJ16_9BACL|nr:sensor histidine kinase [Paenibacillus spongiae]UVI32665.1 sensor histidine kinase [Paenibacillus spongiae]